MPKKNSTNKKENILIGPMAGYWITNENYHLVLRCGDMEFIRQLNDEEYELSRRFVNEILFDKATKVHSVFRGLDKEKPPEPKKSKHPTDYYPSK